MNLRELDPKWIVASTRLRHEAEPLLDEKIGLRFLCPVHVGQKVRGVTCEVAVYFANPIGGAPGHARPVDAWYETTAHQAARQKPLQRRGEEFDTLTLEGRIDHDRHWSGRVRAGAVVD